MKLCEMYDKGRPMLSQDAAEVLKRPEVVAHYDDHELKIISNEIKTWLKMIMASSDQHQMFDRLFDCAASFIKMRNDILPKHADDVSHETVSEVRSAEKEMIKCIQDVKTLIEQSNLKKIIQDSLNLMNSIGKHRNEIRSSRKENLKNV